MDRSGHEHTDDNSWFDVQATLQAAAGQLQPGEMLQAEHFNLFEAMSAVEIGDPKMDAGLDTASPPTPDQLIEQGLASLELSHQQHLAILDQLAAMQASWHVGNSLAQTVFVCLYMLKPNRQDMFQLTSNWSVHPASSADRCPAPSCRTAQNQVLSAYCEATRACCDAVRNVVLHASVCEVSTLADHSSCLPLPIGACTSCAKHIHRL